MKPVSLEACLRNSCANERPWKPQHGERPNTRSISLEAIGFVLRRGPHRALSHDDAAAVAHATPNVRFQVRRLHPSELSSALLAWVNLQGFRAAQASRIRPRLRAAFRRGCGKSAGLEALRLAPDAGSPAVRASAREADRSTIRSGSCPRDARGGGAGTCDGSGRIAAGSGRGPLQKTEFKVR